jgi:hypothetical protein
MAKRGGKKSGRDPGIKAKAILDCVALGDAATSKKYGISIRTLQRWHLEFKSGQNAELAGNVAEKKSELDKAWLSKIPEALSACFDYVISAARNATKDGQSDPDTIHAVAGAIKIISDTDTGYKFIDARISGQVGSVGTPDKPVPAGANVVPMRRAGS